MNIFQISVSLVIEWIPMYDIFSDAQRMVYRSEEKKVLPYWNENNTILIQVHLLIKSRRERLYPVQYQDFFLTFVSDLRTRTTEYGH